MAEVFPLDINDAGDEDNLSSDDEFVQVRTDDDSFDAINNVVLQIRRDLAGISIPLPSK